MQGKGVGVGRLGLFGVGVSLPDSVEVAAAATAAGGDGAAYQGWLKSGRAGAEDHPSTLGREALERALEASGVQPGQVDLVIFTGVSRDYPASWSVATELIELCGIGRQALGMDMMAGCLATLSALDFAAGWLAQRGGGYAAIVAAEKWTQTVDLSSDAAMGMWGYGDGAAATIVGLETGREPLLEYVGAEYCNAAHNNGYVRMTYGGTREPVAPPGVNPHQRTLSGVDRYTIMDLYRAGYSEVWEKLRSRFELAPTHLVCNQTAPGMVAIIADLYGLSDQLTLTGHETGHTGGPDILIGLAELLASGEVPEQILVAASAAYVFGASALVRPGTEVAALAPAGSGESND